MVFQKDAYVVNTVYERTFSELKVLCFTGVLQGMKHIALYVTICMLAILLL